MTRGSGVIGGISVSHVSELISSREQVRRIVCSSGSQPSCALLTLIPGVTRNSRMGAMRKLPVVPVCRKLIACLVGQISRTFSPVSALPRGALRDRHERWAWDAVGASVCSLIIQADEQTDATAKSCGPDLPVLGSSFADDEPRDDGGNQSRSPGRARITRSNHCAGEAGYWADLWFCRVLFVARGPWVSADTRPSLRPLFQDEG